MTKGSKNHVEKCRSCGIYHRQDQMIHATKVLRRSSRGWFCSSCADEKIRLNNLIRRTL